MEPLDRIDEKPFLRKDGQPKAMIFRPTPELEAKIEKKVEKLLISRNRYLSDAINLYTDFDSDFLVSLFSVSEMLETKPADLIQSIFSRFFADINAYQLTYGKFPDDLSLYVDIPMGDYHENMLKHMNNKINEQEKKLIVEGLKTESNGHEPEEHIKRIMIKYQVGKAWLQSEEYKKFLEIQECVKNFDVEQEDLKIEK